MKSKVPVRIGFLCTFSTVPRTMRMAKVLANAGYIIDIIEWDRSGSKPKIEVKDDIVFRRLRLRSGYGLRIFYLVPIWILFAFFQIIIGKYSLIQPQGLSCLIPAVLASKIKKQMRIIYDLADFYADAYLAQFPIIRRLSAFLERFLIKRVDALILVSERQVLQVKRKNLPKKVLLYYNIPEITLIENIYNSKKEKSGLLIAFYVGVLAYDRVKLLINVIEAIKNLPVKVIIAGFGECEKLMRKISMGNEQVEFLGPLDHYKAMMHTLNADVVLLPYDPSYFNNKIGLPNKFFEAMACGTMVLAQSNTYMGEITRQYKLGMITDYRNPIKIRQTIKAILAMNENDIISFRENAKRLFFEKFNPMKINCSYLNLVKTLVEN